MFVRKRANGNQLLEAYRDEEGKKRNRVVCSLGEHETPEAALEAAEAELEALLERPRRAARRVATYEERFKDDYAEGLAKWHGGEIPPLEEVLELARGIHAQAGYDPAWGRKMDPFLEGSEYAMDFIIYNGYEAIELHEYIWDLRDLEKVRAEAQAAWDAGAPERRRLEERIAALKAVVSE
jgi:hypothetical protein